MDSNFGPSSCSCLLDDLSWGCVLGPLEVNIHTVEMPSKAGIWGGLFWPPVNLLKRTQSFLFQRHRWCHRSN